MRSPVGVLTSAGLDGIPMPLDATVNGPDSNSYLTLAEYNEYLATHVSGGAAAAETDAEKEASLITSTRLMDAMFLWTGSAATETQRLAWGRNGMTNRNGYPIPPDVLPRELKEATAELGRVLTTTDTTAPSDAAVQGLTQVTAGPITLKFKDILELKVIPDSVKLLIPPWWYTGLVTDPEPATFDFEVMQTDPWVYSSRRVGLGS